MYGRILRVFGRKYETIGNRGDDLSLSPNSPKRNNPEKSRSPGFNQRANDKDKVDKNNAISEKEEYIYTFDGQNDSDDFASFD